MYRVLGWVVALVAIVSSVPAAMGQEAPASLSVGGAVATPGSWTVEALKQQFAGEAKTVKFTPAKDKPEQVGTGVPLLSLIKAAGLKTEKTPKHHDLTFLVIIEAKDSYRVFFSMAELLPQCAHDEVYVVWEVDDKPLSEREAPFRLVVATDKGHDRYIYAISKITLVDGTKLATALAAPPQP